MVKRRREPPSVKRPTKHEEDESVRMVYGFILTAMRHFAPGGQAIDKASLLRICITGGCPSPAQAEGIIQKMVNKKILTEQVDRGTGQRSYYITTDASPAENN